MPILKGINWQSMNNAFLWHRIDVIIRKVSLLKIADNFMKEIKENKSAKPVITNILEK